MRYDLVVIGSGPAGAADSRQPLQPANGNSANKRKGHCGICRGIAPPKSKVFKIRSP